MSDEKTSCVELTLREQEVLQFLIEGMSNCEIGDTLCVSLSTVETHLHHIYRKLGVKNRMQAAKWYHANCGGVETTDSGET
jgi:LuxR family transcriptional regulator of csgAB operon